MCISDRVGREEDEDGITERREKEGVGNGNMGSIG
jgi:hypothetical protein